MGIPVSDQQTRGAEVPLYALKGNRDNPPLGGDVVVDARQEFDQMSRVVVSMQMNGRGAKVWEEMTGKAFQNASQIAIVLDNIVYSAPGVTTGAISGGRSQISVISRSMKGKIWQTCCVPENCRLQQILFRQKL